MKAKTRRFYTNIEQGIQLKISGTEFADLDLVDKVPNILHSIGHQEHIHES